MDLLRMSLLLVAIALNVLLGFVSSKSIQAIRMQKRAAFYIANETACVVDNIVYYNGDPIPTDDPCESCKCRPPGFACVLRECEVKPGCRAVRRAGHCCPEYVCGCEHDGRMYRDGDEIRDAQNPCYTCYCQGSAIACSFTDCFFRVDCTPEYIPGECCPVYNHCPAIGSGQNNTISQDQPKTVEATIFTTSEAPKTFPTETSSTTSSITSTEIISDLDEERKDADNDSEEEMPKAAPSTHPPKIEEITTRQYEDERIDELKSTSSPSLLYVPEEDSADSKDEPASSEEDISDVIPKDSPDTDGHSKDHHHVQPDGKVVHHHHHQDSSEETEDEKPDNADLTTLPEIKTDGLVETEDGATTTSSSKGLNEEAEEIKTSEASELTQDSTTPQTIITPLPILFHNAEAELDSEKESMALLDGSKDDDEIKSITTEFAIVDTDTKKPTKSEETASTTIQSVSSFKNSLELKESEENVNISSVDQLKEVTPVSEELKEISTEADEDKESSREGKLNKYELDTDKEVKLTTDVIQTTKESEISTASSVTELTEKTPMIYSEDSTLKQTITTESSTTTTTEKVQPTTLAIIKSTTNKESTTANIITDKTTIQ